MPLFRVLLFWFAFVSYPVLRGDEPDRLVVIRDAFAREMEKVGGESNQKRWDLKNGYLKSLNRLLEANISSGNSEIVLSLNDEISLVKSGKPLDPLDGKKVDPRLKELRRKYLEAEKALSDERVEKETELRIVGIRALTELSRNTTKSGDIDAVRAIENQIVEWRSKLPSSNDQKRIASIIPDGEGTLKRFREDQILWTVKAVEILEIPDELDGLSFNYTGKELNSVRVRESGTVYALTAAPGASNDRSRELISAGFKRASIDSFQLYGAHPADFVAIYEKDVKADEILTFRKFAIILGQR